jgi:hypothetical protein
VALRHCLFFELLAEMDTAIVLRNVEDSTVDTCIFWMLKGGTRDGGAVALSVRESMNSTTTIQGSSFFHCDDPRGSIVRAFDGSRIVMLSACSTSNRGHLIGDGEGIELGDDSRLFHECADRFRVVAPTVFGYHTFNQHAEIVTRRGDMFDGVIIGALVIIVFAVPTGVTMMLMTQIAKLWAGEENNYARIE